MVAVLESDHLGVVAGRVEAEPADLDRGDAAVSSFGGADGHGAGPHQFPGQRVVRSLMLLPLVLPPVVGGIALLYTFGRRGLLGQSLEVLGIQIAFSTTAVVLAQTFVALPFLVVSLEGTLRAVGQRYEVVAATLGGPPTTVLRRVTLPLVLPGLVSGAVLSFARSFGEFGATLTFAGSLQGVTRTLPLEIYLQRRPTPTPRSPCPWSWSPSPCSSSASPRAAVSRSELTACAPSLAARDFDVDFGLAAGERRGGARPERCRKSTLLAILAGIAAARRGPRRARRTVLFDLGGGDRVAAAAQPRRGAAGPGSVAVPAPERSRQRRLRPQVRRPAASAPASTARDGWRRSAPASSPTGSRLSCPEDRPNGSRSRGRWPPSPGCCCSTNRWPRSMSARRPCCVGSCGGCWPTGRRSSSPTTSSTPCCSRTDHRDRRRPDRRVRTDRRRHQTPADTVHGPDRRPQHDPGHGRARRGAPARRTTIFGGAPHSCLEPGSRRSRCSARPRSRSSPTPPTAVRGTRSPSPSPSSNPATNRSGYAPPGRSGTTFIADVTAQTIGDLDLYPGREVWYAVKATAVTIYPA